MAGTTLSTYRDQHFKVWISFLVVLFCTGLYIVWSVCHSKVTPTTKTYCISSCQGSRVEQEKLLAQSCTLYVGNLSFFTTEEQIHELFSKCGDVKRIIMGLDKFTRTPCGFCFIEYHKFETHRQRLPWLLSYFIPFFGPLAPFLFCFVSFQLHRYYNRNEAEDAIRFINGTRLDDRIIRCDWDAGFIEGRQYGRGKTGGQVNN